MTLARISEETLWRRLVWWSRASEGVLGGCAFVVALAVLSVPALFMLGVHVVPLLVVTLAIGVGLESVRRLCEVARERALDAAVQRLGASYGLSREELAAAANSLPSGRIEELQASLAFSRDPVHRMIEAALGQKSRSVPLGESPGEVRAIVVGLGVRWAVLLRFSGAEVVEAQAHPRFFTWNAGAGPRRVDLALDPDARALIERSIAALRAAAAACEEIVGGPRLLGEHSVAVGMVLVDDEDRAHPLAGVVDLVGGALARTDDEHGGPYRATTRSAALVRSAVVEVDVEEQRRQLAPQPHDERAENVLAFAVVHAVARALRPFALVEPVRVVKGRPLRVDGVPRLAALQAGPAWVDRVEPIAGIDPVRRAALAQRWLGAALTEHASIAAFERLARVLVELDAPASLVERAREASVEEARHARDAFSLAAAYGGAEWGPGPLAAPDGPPPSIDALALETFFDGCVGETVAAREAIAALARCEVPAVRAAIGRVASDERRHAELAWDLLAWLLPNVSSDVRRTIAEASSPRRSVCNDSVGTWLARHGWLTAGEERAVTIAAWRDEIGPRRDALLGVRRVTSSRSPWRARPRRLS